MNQPTMRPRIGIDCDGVLADFNGYCVRLINHLFGTNHLPSAVVEWDFDHLIPEESYDHVGPFPYRVLTRSQGVELLRQHLNKPGVAASLEPFAYARQLVNELSKLGELWVVTSAMHTSPTWYYERLGWLQCVLGIDRHRVHVAADKSSFDGAVLIDDRALNLSQWEDGGHVAQPTRRGILWKRPYSGPWAGWWVESPGACVTTVERALQDGGW